MTEPLKSPTDPILLVEDDPGTAHLVRERLEETGWVVAHVSTGWEALAWLDVHATSLVILDHSLPDMTGEELAQMVALPPFIVCTGTGSERLAVSLMKLGARDYLVKDAAFLDDLVPTVRRVMKELATEARLREVETSLQIKDWAIHSALNPFAMADLEGRLTYVNPAFLDLWGYDHPAQVLGHSVVEFWQDPASAHQAQTLSLSLGGWEGELVAKRSDGALLFLQVATSPVRNLEGRPVCHQASFVDLTARRQMETALRDSEARLHKAQRMESLGSLAGGVAHDMNNVLGAILGLASAHLEIQPKDSPAWKAFSTIATACTRGGRMVHSLLDFARQGLAEALPLDLNLLVEEEVQLLAQSILARTQVELALAPDLPLIRGDAGALSHALMNLCSNAVDAMEGAGRLRIETAVTPSGRVELRVVDQGCGMDPGIRDKVTEPFFTTKPQGKGTGLGLAIVYGAMKAHQGSLDIQSTPGKGTCVTLSFSACEAPGPRAQATSAPRSLTAPLEVLLVDDDELIQRSLQVQLTYLGHRTLIAPSGEEALQRLQEGLRPDLVILDLNMPGMGGAATLPALRALLPDVPVLLATGRPDQTALALAQANPGVKLLPKPFRLEDLQNLLPAMAVRLGS